MYRKKLNKRDSFKYPSVIKLHLQVAHYMLIHTSKYRIKDCYMLETLGDGDDCYHKNSHMLETVADDCYNKNIVIC